MSRSRNKFGVWGRNRPDTLRTVKRQAKRIRRRLLIDFEDVGPQRIGNTCVPGTMTAKEDTFIRPASFFPKHDRCIRK